MYSPETMEVLNQPVETVKVKRVLSDEHKAKMAEGRKRKKEMVMEAIVEEVVSEGVGIIPEDVVETEIDEAVAEIIKEPKIVLPIVPKRVDDSIAPKWFKEYLTEKEKRRKKKNVGSVAEKVSTKPGKLVLPEVAIEEKPPIVNHLMRSIFPNRYK